MFYLIMLIFSNEINATVSQRNFDVIYYEIDIRVDPATEIIDGFVTVLAISKTDDLSEMVLDFYDNMNIDSVAADGVSYVHENNLLNITLNQNFNENDTISVAVFYNGHPEKVGQFNPMTFDHSRSTVSISSESCPFYARCWWPCKDRPDDKPETMDVKIAVPPDLVVASNGKLIEVTTVEGGFKKFHWKISNPIATYLVAFTATDYQIIEDNFIDVYDDTLQIMTFVYPEHYNAALVDFDNVQQMIEVLSAYYGKYPYFNEKYGIAEYVGYWGGMEYQTLSCLKPFMFTGDHSYDATFLHELAHQWWGDCVTPNSFHHSWLSEGFAVFSEALYYGFLEGEEKYFDYMSDENDALNLKGTLYRYNISHPDTVYDYIVYNKGAWVIHMLRHVVGEDNFWSGLTEFMNRYKYSSATTEDLQQTFEDVVGHSLEWFFHQWVYEPNYPHYAYGWHEPEIAGDYVVTVFVDQIQTDAPLFNMPIDLTLVSAVGESSVVVTVDDSTEAFDFTPLHTIIDVKFDEKGWILKKSEQFTSPILKHFSHQVIDSTENNNGLAEPGESVSLNVQILNQGLPAYDMVIKLISEDPDIEIPTASQEISYIGEVYGHLADDLIAPFSFSVSPSAASHITTFKLEMESRGEYTTIDSFEVGIGSPDILLVDDDNGENYEDFFFEPMKLARIYAGSWDVALNGIPTFSDQLQNYQTIIWLTGDDRSTSLTSVEQQQIMEYLDNGGELLLTGQNIGYDLVEDGSVEDSLFYSNYLSATYLADTVNSTMMSGIPGDPIGDRMFINIDPKAGGAGNQHAPSEISPINGAVTFLRYIPQMSSAGIHHLNESSGHRVVYLPFGFEGITGPYSYSAQTLLSRIITWLQSDQTKIKISPDNLSNHEYRLEQNFPNPFNPVTKIKFSIPEADFVKLTIYNLLGQKIALLLNDSLLAGSYEKNWDATNDNGTKVSAGIYIYQLKAGSYKSSKKLLLLK